MFLSLRVHFAEFGPIPTKFFVDDLWVVTLVVDILQGGVRLLTPLYKYVRRESNDPPIITKNIPARINKRLSSRPFHRTKHRSTKLPLHTKKYSTRTNATTLYSASHLQLTKEKTDNETTFSHVQPSIQQKRQPQYRSQIPHPR